MSLFSLQGFRVKKGHNKEIIFFYFLLYCTLSQHYLTVFLENNNVTKMFVSSFCCCCVMYCFYFPFPDEKKKTVKHAAVRSQKKNAPDKIQMCSWYIKQKNLQAKKIIKMMQQQIIQNVFERTISIHFSYCCLEVFPKCLSENSIHARGMKLIHRKMQKCREVDGSGFI